MSNDRLKRTIASALWSAYADALGFPTELASDKTIQQRLGHSVITRTESWKRLVGGRFGAKVTLPAGAYSDDTQLRLATSRTIRGDGYFDVEAFAKIELTSWQAYALGAGRGSKAAAAALCNRSNAWFSNFFNGYVNGGGNGAAMRVQPHVWAAADLDNKESYLPDVIRNAICTHGHMRGIAGAVVHAVSLAHAFQASKAPTPENWLTFAEDIRQIPNYIASDSDLSTFWLPAWEQASNQKLRDAAETVAREWEESAHNAISLLRTANPQNQADLYEAVVKSEKGLTSAERGSGLKCALFANVAAWMCANLGAQETIQLIANLLDSDTDTIATMAGALIGVVYPDAKYIGPIQDEIYIRDEATRLFQISQGVTTESFTYPDMLYWQPPRTTVDILTQKDGRIYLEGLGEAHPLTSPFVGSQKSTSWQWFMLATGQTVLSKFRTGLMTTGEIASYPLQGDRVDVLDTLDLFDQSSDDNDVAWERFDFEGEVENAGRPASSQPFVGEQVNQAESGSSAEDDIPESVQQRIFTRDIPLSDGRAALSKEVDVEESNKSIDLDSMTNEAIRNFDQKLIGQHILLLAEQPGGIELSLAYVAIIVKARSARLKHKSKL